MAKIRLYSIVARPLDDQAPRKPTMLETLLPGAKVLRIAAWCLGTTVSPERAKALLAEHQSRYLDRKVSLEEREVEEVDRQIVMVQGRQVKGIIVRSLAAIPDGLTGEAFREKLDKDEETVIKSVFLGKVKTTFSPESDIWELV